MGKRGLVAVWFVLTGCTAHPGRLLVAVDTDYPVPSRVASIRVVVTGIVDDAGTPAEYDGGPPTDTFPVSGRVGELDAGARELLPLSFMVRARHRDQRIEVRVEGLDADGEVLVSRRAVTGFLEDRTLVLPIFLARACGTDAVPPVMCGADQTCNASGECEPVAIDPRMLPPIDELPDGSLDPFDASRDAGPTMDASPSDADTSDAGPTDAGCTPGPDCEVIVEVRSSPTSEYSCARTNHGFLLCWGRNEYGQLARGRLFDFNPYPFQAFPVEGVLGFVTGGGHTCSTSIGALTCWGSNAYGEFGDGTEDASGTMMFTPETVQGTQYDALAAGEHHTCGLLAGAVDCWGHNDNGQVDPSEITTEITLPSRVGGFARSDAITAGRSHSCARVGGQVWCWGDNRDEQLGAVDTLAVGPLRVQGLATAVELRAGERHTCALLSDGAVFCWGRNMDGDVAHYMLGSSTTAVDSSAAALLVERVVNADELAVGGDHACARVDGRILCWGRNDHGQLGNGEASVGSLASFVIGIDDAVQITAGALHTCALRSDSSVWCWGSNDYGEVGDGSTIERRLPVRVSWP